MRFRRAPSRGASSLALMLAVLLVAAALVGYFGWRFARGRDGAEVAPPVFSLAALDGRYVGPADYRGQVLLLDFWATWCGPCHVQADILKPLYDEYRRHGVEFLAISVGEGAEQVREFVERRPYPYPVLVDPEDEVSAQLDIIVLPTLMILDRAGEVTYFEPGIADAATIRRLLQEAGA